MYTTQGRPVLLYGDVVYVRLAAAPTAEYGGYVVTTDGALCLAGMPSAFWADVRSRWAFFSVLVGLLKSVCRAMPDIRSGF